MSEEQQITFKRWLWLLLSSILTGAGTSLAVATAAMTLSPQTFNDASHWNFLLIAKLAGIAFSVGALGGAANYLAHSPLSSVKVNLLLACFGLLWLTGCASFHIPIGADEKYGSVDVTARYNPPPSFTAWADAPKALPLTAPDWKSVRLSLTSALNKPAPASGRNGSFKEVVR